MKKLERVKLKDVLSHVETDVNIGPCVTVFSGESNSGKSSVWRGLYQAMCNQPAGIDLLRHSAKRGACSETTLLGTDDTGKPVVVLRRRGNSRNEYEVNGELLKAFGLGVPNEVQNILNLSPNAFQSQSDGHFLLKETDGEVARVLGRTVGLSDIDAAFAYVRKLKTENDTTLRVAESDVQRETQSKSAYVGVDNAIRAVEAFECVLEETRKLNTVCNETALLIKEHNIIPQTVSLTTAKETIGRLREFEEIITHLYANVRLIENLRREILAVPRPVRTVPAVSVLCNLLELANKADAQRKVFQNLQNLKLSVSSVPDPVETGYIREWIECLIEIRQGYTKNLLRQEAIRVFLSELNSCSPFDPKDIEIAAGQVTRIKLWKDNAADVTGRIEKLDYLVKCLKVVSRNVEESEKEICQLQSEIDNYLVNNPVCTVCGSEQQYWKKG